MTGEASAADILTAASIMAGVLSFIYAHAHVWVTNILDFERGERQAADLRKERREALRACRLSAAVSLFSLTLGAIFTWEIVELVRNGHVFGAYEPITLSLVVVWLLFLGVGGHSAWSALRLWQKRTQLS
jgi:hypothetical protein